MGFLFMTTWAILVFGTVISKDIPDFLDPIEMIFPLGAL